MRKIRNGVLTFLFALIVISCGNQTKNTTTEDADLNEKVYKANDVIIYTNAVIEYLNKTGEWLDYNNDSFSELIELGTKKIDPGLDYHASEGPVAAYIKPKMVEAVKTVTGSLSKEDSIQFKQTMEKFDQTLNSIDANRDALSKYIRTKDFKTDDYAKGKLLADTIKKQLDYIYDTKFQLYTKIDDLASKAEEQILQTHPLKDPIMAMRADMSMMDKLYDGFLGLSEGKAVLKDVQAEYDALATSVQKHKDMYKDIMNEGQAKRYNLFYQKMDELLDTYRGDLNSLIDVKNPSKYKYYNFDRMKIDIDAVVNSYNSFVG